MVFIIQLECEGKPIKVTDTTIDILDLMLDSSDCDAFDNHEWFNTSIGEVKVNSKLLKGLDNE